MKEAKRRNKENLIGKTIYGFLLFMPLLAIAITCAYAIFNKNAYQSYYGDTINEEQTNIVNGNLEVGITYTTSFKDFTEPLLVTSPTYNITNFAFIDCLGTNPIPSNVTIKSFQLIYNTSNCNIKFVDTNDTSYYYSYIQQISNPQPNYSYYYIFSYKIITSQTLPTEIQQKTTYTTYIQNSFLSEVFYYSVDKVEESNLFNWSKDTGMYTTVHGATELLGITNTFIPMLMSYWLLISVIYIVYDIALVGVHMVHNKIHDFENVI